MASKDNRTEELRRRAEEDARNIELEDFKSMSPEETRRTLHDLRVHQIELNMQNEELCRVQAEITAARERYFDLYDMAPAGYCTLSEKGLILEANLTAASLLDMARSALVKRPITRFIHSEDQKIYYHHHKKLLDTGDPQDYELRMMKQDGAIFWARLKINNTKDTDGAHVYRVMINDITAQKLLENELRVKDLAIESSLNAISISDLKGFLNYANPAFLDMWGYNSTAEVCGKSAPDFWSEGEKTSEFIETIRYHGSWSGELVARRKDGEIFDAQASVNLISDAAGRPICMLGLFSNITERKKAENIIIEAEIKLRKIFASINDSIIITDLSGKILEVNEYACQKLKYEKDEILKMTLKDINAENHRQDIDHHLKNLVKSGKTVYESHYLTKDGTIFPVEIKASLTEFLEKPALLILISDISERINIENALQESEKRYHELIEISSEGFWVVNNEGNTIYLNQQMADMIGYTISEIGTKNISEFIHEESLSSLHGIFSKITQGSLRQHESQFKHKNGKMVYVTVSTSFLTDREGNTTGKIALVTDITEKVELEKQFELVKKEISKNYTLGDIVGKSEYMQSIFEILPSISECDSNIMIEGPSGTGKSLIARTAHNLSARRDGPFVVINCGALPETLLESELFGYTKGAFTDAKKDKPGKFLAADNGTIFLDEIGEMPLHLQVKLLRVIEEKCFEPLGSTGTVKVNFRLIAATNKNLKMLVSEGKFREDLYYRLRVVYINIPPLRERREDLELLANSFINKLNVKDNKNINKFSDEVRTILRCYDFPGNARELYNMLEYAYILCKDDKIKLADLPEEYAAFYNQLIDGANNTSVSKTAVLQGNVIPAENGAIKNNTDHATICKDETHNDETNRKAVNADDETICKINGITKENLIKVLTKQKYNKNNTAKALNTSRVTLWRLMKKFGITD